MPGTDSPKFRRLDDRRPVVLMCRPRLVRAAVCGALLLSRPGWIAFRGVVQKKHAFVRERLIKFLDKLSLVVKGRRGWRLCSHQSGPGG